MPLMLTLADISPDTWAKPITDTPQVVGRDKDADIHLESRFISKQHCRFWEENGQYFVEDCGSTNGTYLRGKRIQREALKSGDRVLIGNFEIIVADDSQIRPTDYELPSTATLFDQSTVALPLLEADTPSHAGLSVEERRLTAAIHQRLTPSRRIGLPGMLIEVGYLPSGLPGGDCFECFELSDRYVLALFDSMNHGTKAALTIMLIRSELRRWVSLTHEPGKCLEQLNSELVKLQINDLYICATLAMWFPVTSTLVYATAGQHPPIWFRGDDWKNPGETAGGPPLGINDTEAFEEKLLQLRSGDRLFFFSDGLGDAIRHGNASPAAAQRVAHELQRLKAESLQTSVERLMQAPPGAALDDALLVACEIGTPSSASN